VTPGEVTSDHGWDLPRQTELVRSILARINDAGIRSAIFIDPDPELMDLAPATETQRVEIYTEPYAAAYGTDKERVELDRFRACAQRATAAGIGVNAGHDLNLLNMPIVAREIPELLEVSIGHALVADALYIGLEEAVRRYVSLKRGEVVDAPKTR
jgi:pyridoxine 5-phosphate synthase